MSVLSKVWVREFKREDREFISMLIRIRLNHEHLCKIEVKTTNMFECKDEVRSPEHIILKFECNLRWRKMFLYAIHKERSIQKSFNLGCIIVDIKKFFEYAYKYGIIICLIICKVLYSSIYI